MNGNHAGLVWKIIGPIIAAALLTVSGYFFRSLDQEVKNLSKLVYELNGLVRGHIGPPPSGK